MTHYEHVVYITRDLETDSPETTDQICTAVRRLMREPDLYSRLSQNGRDFAVEHHDVKKVAAQYDAVFQASWGRRKGRRSMSVRAQDRRTDLVTLGSADIWINGVDVGHIKGDVTLACEREYVPFKPANELSPVKNFRIREGFKITCTAPELRLADLKTALGITTSIADSDVAADKRDSQKCGRKTIEDFTLRLEHTRPNGNKVIILLYKAQCISNIDYAFKEEEISMQTLEFQGLIDMTRAIGDRVGIMFEQIT